MLETDSQTDRQDSTDNQRTDNQKDRHTGRKIDHQKEDCGISMHNRIYSFFSYHLSSHNSYEDPLQMDMYVKIKTIFPPMPALIFKWYFY